MHPKTVGLIAHSGKPGVGELINSLAAELSRHSMSILLEKGTATVSGNTSELTVAQIGAKADLIVVAGGDGTILNVADQWAKRTRPFLGSTSARLDF